MLEEIEILRAKLNEMVSMEGVVLCSEDIVKLSQKLDRLIFTKEFIEIRRSKINFKEQLKSFICQELYDDISVILPR